MSSPFSQLRAYQRYMRWQGYQASPIEQFSGLDLLKVPDESAAVDILNVDFDKRGSMRSRDGYDNFTSSAGANRYDFVFPFYKTDGTRQLITRRNQTLEVINTSGGSVATQALGGAPTFAYIDAARFGGPTAEVAYIGFALFTAGAWAPFANPYKWDGSTFTAVTLSPTTPYTLAVSPVDNRLAAVPATARTRVYFSDPGAPETFGANNFADLTPGDGEVISRLQSWRELVFAFKESKFFVFYGTSIDSTGNPVFNRRSFGEAGLVAPQAIAAAPEGVYFLDRKGLYLTSGSTPQLISRVVTPIFDGTIGQFFASSALNAAQVLLCSMTYHNRRLYLSFPSGSATANDRILVYDIEANLWTLFDIPAADLTPFRIGDRDELIFSYASGANHIGRHAPAFTNDDGAAITSRYRSGFMYHAGGSEGRIRETIFQGTGTVTFKGSTDWGSLNAGESVTMGTSPAVAEGSRPRGSFRGRNFSWQVSSTTAWSIERMVLMLAGARDQVEQ